MAFVALGAMALTAYGVVAALQPSREFGRVLAAYGGVFIMGSLLWRVAFDGFHPDRSDVIGAAICLIGVAVIMYSRCTPVRARPARRRAGRTSARER